MTHNRNLAQARVAGAPGPRRRPLTSAQAALLVWAFGPESALGGWHLARIQRAWATSPRTMTGWLADQLAAEAAAFPAGHRARELAIRARVAAIWPALLARGTADC